MVDHNIIAKWAKKHKLERRFNVQYAAVYIKLQSTYPVYEIFIKKTNIILNTWSVYPFQFIDQAGHHYTVTSHKSVKPLFVYSLRKIIEYAKTNDNFNIIYPLYRKNLLRLCVLLSMIEDVE